MLAVVLVSGGSVSAIALWQLAHTVTTNALDISNGHTAAPSSPKMGSLEGGFNVLVAGVDNSSGQAKAFGHRDSTLNDVNMLLHISADHTTGVVLSLPRDLVIPQPTCTNPDTGTVSSAVSAQPINTAFGRGGLGCVVATVQELTGLTISYAGLISFKGTVAMADAVGGVPICLSDPIDDPLSGLDLPAGTSVVSGKEALSYLRSRHGVGDGSDLARISSQQAYMSSLMRVMKSSATLNDVPKLVNLANAAAANVRLSTSLAGIPTMVGMALALKDVSLDHLVFVQYPTGEDPYNKNKVVPSPALAEQLLAKITSDQPFGLDAQALGRGAELEADAPAATPTPPAPTTSPGETDATPEVIAGLKGQTANQQTCSVASRR